MKKEGEEIPLNHPRNCHKSLHRNLKGKTEKSPQT